MTEENQVAPEVDIIRSELQVTNLIRGKQRAYGVPDNQFLRYAQYCNRRCKTIRAKLGIKGGKEFDLTPDRYQNSQHIELLVLQADGIWARFRELKLNARGPRRQHALRRLRKCLVWWTRAQEAAKTFGTESTQLEVNAFANYASATLSLELGHWADALKKFVDVSETFKALGQSTNDSNLAHHCHDITEDIEPLLVYCRYNMGESENIQASAELKEKVKNIVSINALNSSTRKVSEVKWRGLTIPINHEGLKSKLANIVDLINDTQSEISDHEFRVTLFDRLIAESHGARQIVHNLAQQNTNEDLARLDHFLRWNSFVATLERSHALIGSFNTAAERAEFAGRTYSRIVEVRPQFEADTTIEAYEYLWHAIKCFYIGEAKSGAETITMLQRAFNHATKTLQIIESESIEDPPALKNWAERILTKIRTARIEAVASVNGLKKDSENTVQKPFLSDQKSYTQCDTLVVVPPKAKVITPKPMIFDLAGDYLQFPSLEGKLKKKGLVSKLKFW